MLLKEAPFLALFWLPSFSMVAPLDGVAHGRHDGDWSEDVRWCWV